MTVGVARKRSDLLDWDGAEDPDRQRLPVTRDPACGRVAEKDVANRKEEREIEDCCETSVDIVPAPLSADEKRSDGWIRMEDFTDGGEPRIDAAKRGVPVRPEFA